MLIAMTIWARSKSQSKKVGDPVSTSDTPSGQQSAQGSDGSYAERQTQPGFPSANVQTVQSGNGFNDMGSNRVEGGGPAAAGPSK
ncbi:MAG: hypothetical protein C0483_18755 [Pirellula sp.]|nr:hypothetical protein [Pirellula sp.]